MNDVLINEKLSIGYTSLYEKSTLDTSSNKFCSGLLSYKRPDSPRDFSFGDFDREVKNNDNNHQYLYKKSSLRKYLVGGITEESSILPNDGDNDCLICYDERGMAPIVSCSLCLKFVHYKCYKKFTKKNKFYTMKCVQCGTRSLQFTKKCWQSWCCF